MWSGFITNSTVCSGQNGSQLLASKPVTFHSICKKFLETADYFKVVMGNIGRADSINLTFCLE